MRLFIFALLMVTPLFAFASSPDHGGVWSFGHFFSEVARYGSDISDFIFIEVPDLAHRAYAYMVAFYIYVKIQVTIESLQFAVGVAKVIMSDMGVISGIDNAFNLLPNDTHALLGNYGIIRALNIMIEAVITRFVFNFSVFK